MTNDTRKSDNLKKYFPAKNEKKYFINFNRQSGILKVSY